jgi:hypothetical protein
MAYRRRSYSRRQSSYRPARRRTASRRTTSRRRSSPREVRIVIEQPQATPGREMLGLKPAPAPRRGRF